MLLAVARWIDSRVHPEQLLVNHVTHGKQTAFQLSIYDPTLATVMRVFDEQDGIGPSPYAIAFNTIKHQAYVADTTTDQITVLGGW